MAPARYSTRSKLATNSSASADDDDKISNNGLRGSQGTDDHLVKDMANALKQSTKKRKDARRSKIEKDYRDEMEQLRKSTIARLNCIASQNAKKQSDLLRVLKELLDRKAVIEVDILQSTAKLEKAFAHANQELQTVLAARVERKNADIYLCVISGAVKVATVRPDENVQKILSVEFYCLNRGDYDHQLHSDINPYPTAYASGDEYSYETDTYEPATDHPCFELKKLLSGGTFYYSVDFDLTNRLQDRLSEGSAFDIDSLNEDFLWNAYMIDPLIRFRSKLSQNEKVILDKSRMLTSAIRGFVLTVTITAASSPLKSLKSNYPSSLTVLSRLSCRRAGTRFNSRGIDDDGNVANFVESETVLWHPSGLCFSYIQVRGSVPIFWEQAAGLLPNQQKIQVTRSPEATQSAFDKHFEQLEFTYGTVHILNLMSAMKPGEVELTRRYQHHIQRSPLNQIVSSGGTSENRLIQSQFDFHAETKGPGGYEAASMVRRLIQDRADSFAYLLCDASNQAGTSGAVSKGPSQRESTTILQQEGIFRTNCLDCLDRTNLIQTIISQMAIELFLNHHSQRATADFWMRHSSLWADNGDALSKIYAGTGALKSSFTRHGKMSLAGAIADARKSATRMYINNFADKGRQNTIDILLGRLVGQHPVHLYDPINDYITSELQERLHEFSKTETITIWAGTFNLNGKGNGVKEDLSSWLHPPVSSHRRDPEVIAVGFQEMVELSPQQIMSTDPGRRQIWEEAVRLTINKRAKSHSQEEYVLLQSGQLVGAALMVFVKSASLQKIKNVEGSVKKTGMSGMAGNKGAVAIRMDYANTRICFVTAHLAAGFANYDERNRDYRTISHGLRFQRNRTIDDHDSIVWLGDMNYRIGLSDDKVRRLIRMNDLESLYKYDNGTDDYDTSEKTRIPAWCDRILRKGSNLRQIDYATAPLKFSDHRPVYATFDCIISIIDENRKEELSQALYEKRKQSISSSAANRSRTNEDAGGYTSIAAGLPPASSDRRKWWLDNGTGSTLHRKRSLRLIISVGLPARSQIQPPHRNMALNPARPSNPFTMTSEPDWVLVDRSQEGKPSGSESRTPPAPPSRRDTRISPSSNSQSGVQRSRPELALDIGAPGAKTQAGSFSPLVASDLRRKPAPPVPKKPALLSSLSAGPESSRGKVSREPQPTISKGHIDQGSKNTSRPNKVITTPPPPPLWRTGSGIPPAQTQLALNVNKSSPTVRRNSEQQRPPIGTTAPMTYLSQHERGGIGRRDLLDSDNEGAQAIPPLRPSRPT
ncbi:MAG: hypothetical protein Q9170_005979 [Blastenia crenularia]